ncbi:MAG: BspA family leucine-rich repeat surface protein [Clostridiales bacterium]|nr:BspA family leucine-rich repeat surface protein [Clostridiales bacterium]
MLAKEITAHWPGLKLKEEIGHGAYGRVYKVLNTECSPPMEEALKVISIPLAEDEGELGNTFYRSAAETLAREATILSDLSGNPYIVRYYDHAIIPRDSGVGYDILIRMELLTPFKRHVAEHGLLRQDVIKVGIDICRALELCRKRGVIHRDIKPENIFISDVGNYKLGDFGVAVNADKTLGGLSKKGTYSYMAPEVYKGADYGPSIDIYSLGMILYRLLNNDRDAFVPSAKDSVVTFDDTQQALSRRMRGDPLPCPENERGPLWDIVKKATAPLSADRYSTPEEMRAELEMLVDKSDTALLRLPGGGPELTPEPVPKIASLSLTPYRTKLRVGEATALKASVTTISGSYGGAVKWHSSDPSVMSVTADGPQTATVTCIGSGSCYITAEAEGRSQECPFTGLPEEKPEPLPPKDASSSFVYESTSHLSRRFLGWFWYGWKGRQEDETGAAVPPTKNDVETNEKQASQRKSFATRKTTRVAVVVMLVAAFVMSVMFLSDYGIVNLSNSGIAEANSTKTGGVMGDVGNTGTISLDGTTSKNDVASVIFMDTLEGAPEDAADLSATGDGSVLCWTDGNVQYIAGEGGVVAGSSCKNLFRGYKNLTSIYFKGYFDTSNVTDMSNMFCSCTSLTSLNISGDLSDWDTSSVTDMSGMFRGCYSLTSLNLSGWNTSNVTNMVELFANCYVLTTLDLSGWDTSSVTDMCYMFSFCSSLTNFNPDWLDTSNADTRNMYAGTKWE